MMASFRALACASVAKLFLSTKSGSSSGSSSVTLITHFSFPTTFVKLTPPISPTDCPRTRSYVSNGVLVSSSSEVRRRRKTEGQSKKEGRPEERHSGGGGGGGQGDVSRTEEKTHHGRYGGRGQHGDVVVEGESNAAQRPNHQYDTPIKYGKRGEKLIIYHNHTTAANSQSTTLFSTISPSEWSSCSRPIK